MWQDLINGSFEFLGGFFILLSCLKVFRDKKVRGVSPYHVIYFTSWGFWNLYYYPHLDQWTSFAGGTIIVLTNTLWVGMLIYYILREKHDRNSIS